MKNPLQSLMERQLATIQENLTQALDQLRTMELESSAGGGAVTVRITGLGEVTQVRIDPAVVRADDIELLNDLVCAAVREAIRKATEAKKSQISQATPLGALGVDLPDVF